jgi:hypothetical protein
MLPSSQAAQTQDRFWGAMSDIPRGRRRHASPDRALARSGNAAARTVAGSMAVAIRDDAVPNYGTGTGWRHD